MFYSKDFMNNSRVVEWNKERGLLNTCDLNKELKMLQEEAREFMLATEHPHKLQEFADFLFVYCGTLAKFYSSPSDISSSINGFPSNYEKFSVLKSWASDFIEYATEHFTRYYSGDTKAVFTDVQTAFDIVIECNEAKPSKKDKDGKVIKGDDYKSPLEQIKETIGK